ncbi:MAG: ribosomal-protein-alanine N-acetyltransferase [Cyanobacteria bacterium RYN_339]|nr:ribosomal-protein-alanine N-acetyltransferase [Cyanobacteria bacterium RYN_339]
MQTADLPRVVEIEKQCFGERWTINAFANELANTASAYFIGQEGDQIIGYAGYWLILEEGHITTIGVEPRFQRRGYGELLLLHLIDHAARAGAKWLTLEVRASNDSAQRLYHRYGFTSLGKRKAYYQDNNEDALIMWTENIGQLQYQERLLELRQAVTNRGTKAP